MPAPHQVVFKPNEGTGQQSQENDSCSSEDCFLSRLKELYTRWQACYQPNRALQVKLRSSLDKWEKIRGNILYVRLLPCLTSRIKERAVWSWFHVLMGMGSMVKWSQLNFDSQMKDKSTYCVILQSVTKLYLLNREVLKQEKMVCWKFLLNPWQSWIFQTATNMVTLNLALTRLLLQWKSIHKFLCRLIGFFGLGLFFLFFFLPLGISPSRIFSSLVGWLYKHMFENQSKFLRAYKIRDIMSLTELN